MNISYVCFNISSECNMCCPYCYRVGNTKGNVSLEKAKRYVDFLVKNGCETISITGGEPLLNNEWKNIIKYCSDKGLFVILSTNGLQLDLNDDILNRIDVLSLPLDGGNEEVNSKTRSKGHFKKIKKLIEAYVVGNYPFKLKINTVLTRYNFNDLDQLLILLDHSKIIWKIFELREKGEYYQFPADKVVSDKEKREFLSILNNIQHECSIYFMGRQLGELETYNVKPNYIVLDYNGDIFLANDSENRLLFNLDGTNAWDKISCEEMGLLNNQYNEELKNVIKRY